MAIEYLYKVDKIITHACGWPKGKPKSAIGSVKSDPKPTYKPSGGALRGKISGLHVENLQNKATPRFFDTFRPTMETQSGLKVVHLEVKK